MRSFDRQMTAPAVLQVANWMIDGEMTTLYESSSSSLTNSKVRRTSIRPSFDLDDPLHDEVEAVVKSVALGPDDGSLAMLKRECKILEELGDSHPHVLPSLGFAELGSEMMLITRLAPNGDLSQLVPSGSCLEELQVRRLHMQLLSALSFLQSRRIVHGDVKPQNVLLNLIEDAHMVQLADFGLAMKLDSDVVELQHVQGSYGFIPAEVKHHKRLSFAADLFALGVMTFRLLSSYDPFHPASAVESQLEFDDACWLPLSTESKELVTQLLSPEPERRGAAKDLLEGNPWFGADETALVGEARLPSSPRPLKTPGFHTLEASEQYWPLLRACSRS